MGLVTMTLATAITGGTAVGLPPPRSLSWSPDVWVLPSDSLRHARHTISLSVAEYVPSPALEAVMRAAVFSSTEHRYDL